MLLRFDMLLVEEEVVEFPVDLWYLVSIGFSFIVNKGFQVMEPGCELGVNERFFLCAVLEFL